MTNSKSLATAAAVLMAFSIAACGHSRVEANFGSSVQSMVEGQYYDPAAAANPSLDAVEGTGGQRMETVMEAHRGQAGSAQEVSNPLVINVGQ